MTTSDLTDQRIDELAAFTNSPDTYRALQELKRHRAIMARLEVWIAARDRFTDAGASLAALNVHSEYRRPDDAPEVLAYHAAERDLARAGDELYAAGRSK